MEKYDVVVIGAASSGAFFARRMAEKGYAVKVIEKNTKEKVGTKYDIFHLAKAEFDCYGLPKVHKGDKAWAFEFEKGYTASPTGKFPKRSTNPIVGMHMHDYTLIMDEWAQEAGAQIEYGAAFRELIYENGKISGVKYENKDGEQFILARTVVDCSGIESVARRMLSYGNEVENFALTEEDMFFVVLRYIKFTDKNKKLYSNTGWPFYKSWLAPQEDRNGGIFGVGACGSYERAEKMFDDVEKNIDIPKHTVTKVEKGKTPYTRPPYSFVTDNFIVSGDAACLTKPNNGEGIASSMVQIEIAVRVLDEALKSNDTSKEMLWKINVLYNQKQGADFASTRAILTKAVNATQSEFEYFFKHDIIFSEKILDEVAEKPEIKMAASDMLRMGTSIAGGVLGGKISLKTIKSVAEGLILSGKLKEHYLNFPLTPNGYSQWKETADGLWNQVGKMK